MSHVVPTDTSLGDRLSDHGILVAMGAQGLYGQGAAFMDAYEGLDRLLTQHGRVPGVEPYRFPPVLPTADFVGTDYVRSFPDLIGSIHGFEGSDDAHARLLRDVEQGDDWTAELVATGLVMLPASCYPLYPMVAGTLPPAGRTFDVLGSCFRREPSSDPARMQCFHQREFVRIGDPDSALEHRDAWLQRALDILGELGLDVRAEVANDPFFGRAGRMLAAGQRSAELKYEVVTDLTDSGRPTALASANCHLDHLTGVFDIGLEGGGTAHSACIGFGMERIVLALFARHGTDPRLWPSSVVRQLG